MAIVRESFASDGLAFSCPFVATYFELSTQAIYMYRYIGSCTCVTSVPIALS